MSTATQATADVVASVARLTITPAERTTGATNAKKAKKAKKPVADSWEDEDLSSESGSGSDSEREGADGSTSASNLGGTQAPPPTPISPNYQNSPGGGTQAPPPTPVEPGYQSGTFPGGAPSLSTVAGDEPRRPEKTDAVARRMIASALGVKVPKQTEEQKAYDRAMRDKERKRREEEREAEKKRLEEAEKAKRAIWED